MRSLCLVTLLLASCLAVATATDWPVQDHDSPVTALAVRRSDTIDKVRDGIDVVQKFVDIFTSKIFAGTKVHLVAEILSKSLSFIIAIMDLIRGTQSEDPMVRFLREQFAEVNAKLDGISLQVQEVENLIEWTTARSIYSQFELNIKTASQKYDQLLKASASEKEFRRREFVDFFRPHRASAFKLYQGVVESDLLLASSLADALKQFTQNHRNKVMSFLLAMNRVILRGAQLEIAYHALVDSDAAAAIIERDWADRMKTFTYKMKSVEDQVKAVWHSQMTSDASAFITNNRGLSNKDFSYNMYLYLADKFDWQYWIVVAYKDVSGFNNHAVRASQGATFFRVAGGRNVAVGRSMKTGSSWSKAKADQTLESVDAQNHGTSDALFWHEAINKVYPVTSNGATFSMAVCWGCDVWMTSIGNRRSYRAITGRNNARVNAILFG